MTFQTLDVMKRSGLLYWKVKARDSRGNREQSETWPLGVEPGAAPTITGPPNRAEFSCGGDPPTLTWQANHNERYRVVFAKRSNMSGETKVRSGQGYSLQGNEWTVPGPKWKKICSRLATGGNDHTVYYAVYGVDALNRRNRSEVQALMVKAAP